MAMISLLLLSFLSHLIILSAQPGFRYLNCLNNKGNYTITSAYHSNLNILLSNLTSNTQIDYGFYNISYGQNPDRVSAIGLCRGDVKRDACRSCLNNSSILLPKLCPNQKEAMGGYDDCMLRYSNRSIFGVMEDQISIYLWNLNNATDVDKHILTVSDLMAKIASEAAAGDSRRKFATGNETGSDFQTVYGLAQCTPDLSEQDCSDCLVQGVSEISNFKEKIGGQVIKNSCNIRFESSRFYDLVPDDSEQAPPPLPPSPSSTNLTSSKVIEIEPDESIQFDFDTIKLATDDFSEDNKLGQGGFGPVYKGTLYNGQEIAVKRLSIGSGQGNLEFKNEVSLVAKLQHRNLIRLLGFCLEGEERLLIYEFLPNKSLDYFIFDPNKHAQLNWEMRYKIIGGIARGLLYLHEDSRLRIIHCDLKASNIILDEELNPKISDFGMARLLDQSQGNASRIVGTLGYIAPEYLSHRQFSVKSDVFSFGVLVLEIISGEKNNGIFRGQNVPSLPNFVWKNWREGTTSNILDQVLLNGSRNEIMRCIHIGLLCVQENVPSRPTMAEVVVMLNSSSFTLPLPSQPAFLMNYSETTRSSERESNSAQASVDENTITEPCPR